MSCAASSLADYWKTFYRITKGPKTGPHKLRSNPPIVRYLYRFGRHLPDLSWGCRDFTGPCASIALNKRSLDYLLSSFRHISHLTDSHTVQLCGIYRKPAKPVYLLSIILLSVPARLLPSYDGKSVFFVH